MTALDNIHVALCHAGVAIWHPCTTISASIIDPDRLWTFGLALTGTLTGGAVTYDVQTQLKRREQVTTLKERIVIFVVMSTRIIADMQNIQNLIALYKQENPPDFELWQSVHTLEFTPGFKPDILQLDAIVKLKSWTLMGASMHLYSEYAAMICTIARYNEMRSRFIELRSDTSANEKAIAALRDNMKQHIEFIETTSLAIIEEAKTIQRLVSERSKKHFGRADFLKFDDN